MRKKKLWITGLGILAALCPAVLWAGEATSDSAYRQIPIREEDIGYDHFESTVIRSQAEWEDFVKSTSLDTEEDWNHGDIFLKNIQKANLDFEKEALVLIRDTEPSGSIQVSFEVSRLESGTLFCNINRKLPGVTDDEAFYCFAVAVSKEKVKKIHVDVESENPFELDVQTASLKTSS